ncbi:MAG: CHAT domain-containing protein [Bacteroidales bacterium]|nr:CHAT domain-containing protein [Bacteroidales bacterium]
MDVLQRVIVLIICFLGLKAEISGNIIPYKDSLMMKHYYDAGLKMYSEGFYSQALDSFKIAFKTGKKVYSENHPGLRNINNVMGIVYRNIGQYDKALEHFLFSEQSFRNDSSVNETALARIYNNIGNVYYNKFNYGTALEYYQRAANIFLGQADVNLTGVSDIQYSIANIHYELKDNEKALEIIDKYISRAYPKTKLYFLSLKAAVYQVMNRYKEAHDSYMEVIKYAKDLYSQDDLNVAFEYLNFATFLIANSNFNEAGEVLDKVIKIIKNKKLTGGSIVALYHQIKGTYYENLAVDTKDIDTFRKNKSKNLNEAIKCYEKGLKSLNFKITDSGQPVEGAVNTFSLTRSLNLLKNIADTYLQLAEIGERDNDENYKMMILNALHYYSLTSDLIQQARKEIYSESDKILLSELEELSFYKIVKIAFTAHQLTGEMSFAELAFKNAERLKASSVFDRLTDQLAKNRSLIPDSLLEIERILNYNITNLNEKLYNYPGNEQIDVRDKQKNDSMLFLMKRERENLNRYLESNYKEYYNLKYSDSAVNILEIQSKLNNDEVIIEYVLNTNDKTPELYSFFLTSNQYKFIKLPSGNDIEKLTETVFKFLSDKNYLFTKHEQILEYCLAAHKLYELLIRPFESEIKNRKLTIIADGILSYIPFDALLSELPDTSSAIQLTKLSYFILKNSVNYAYSASLLFSDFNKKKRNKNKKLLAIAPEYNNDTIKYQGETYILPALPGTIKEVELISKIIGSVTITGSDATEQNFRKNYKDFDILHLAMHAFINDSLPAFSCLAFAQSNEQENNRWLNTADIYNLDLNARLAVLSACNTGTGKLKKGEGIISLARGFTYAGCPSIIMTLWEAEDLAGTKIMNSFYKNLKKGNPKDKALRNAKLEYLENATPHTAHPHFWIGYVSIGDPSPIFRSYDFYLFLILIFSLLGIITDQLIRLKKNTNRQD